MPSPTWTDPKHTVWGFHVHQEVPKDSFGRALLMQEACRDYMKAHDIRPDAEEAMRKGYGPHLEEMWELRVETLPSERVFEALGLMVAFCAVNRGDVPAYIHPLMHDREAEAVAQLRQEGEANQPNALWFGSRAPQKQEFFFSPPMDPDHPGRVLDTRTPRVYPEEELRRLRAAAAAQIRQNPSADCGYVIRPDGKRSYVDPVKKVVRGFHIHCDYPSESAPLALEVFDRFNLYLLSNALRPSSTRLYGPRENGPHLQGGWEVKFEYRDPGVFERFGQAVAWLMCNRRELPLFMHCVTWEEGDFDEELFAHKQYTFFVDKLPDLDLSFFVKLKEKEMRAKL